MTLSPTGFLRIGASDLEYRMVGPAPTAAPTIVMLHEGLGSSACGATFRIARSGTGCRRVRLFARGLWRLEPGKLPRPHRLHASRGARRAAAGAGHIGFRRGLLLGHSDGASIAAIYAGSIGPPHRRAVAMIAPHFIVEDISVTSIAEIRQAYETRAEGKTRALAQAMSTTPSMAGTPPGSIRSSATGTSPNTSAISASRSQILQGADDQYGTVRQIEIAREECYCPVDVTVIPGAGHQPHREAPGATLDAIADFANADAARRRLAGAGRLTLSWRGDEYAFSASAKPAAAAMGLYPRRDGRGRRRSRHAVEGEEPGAVALPRLRAGAPSRAALWPDSERPRLFLRETQEVLEAVWAAAPQGGRERILLRACIQIANANLRLRMERPHAASRLLGEAHAGVQRAVSCARRRLPVKALPRASRPST